MNAIYRYWDNNYRAFCLRLYASRPVSADGRIDQTRLEKQVRTILEEDPGLRDYVIHRRCVHFAAVDQLAYDIVYTGELSTAA
ncbi:MAG: hypothetical protein KDK27_03465 [Leptospiraceae bacterium]|nr:hypothetical protein [Leptospiraceae bacterium]